MYLTVHAASGLFIGSQVGNPWFAFVLGFVAHFLLDIIPHDPIELENWYKANLGKKEYKRFFFAGLIDVVLLGIIMGALWRCGKNIFEPSIIAGMIGTLLPDFMWTGAIALNIKNRFTEWFYNFHDNNHKLIYRPAYIKGIYAWPIQILFLAIFLWLFLKL